MPLYRDYEEIQPHAFTEGDSFGCSSKVAFGDWVYKKNNEDEFTQWMRLTNYGVFHCAAIVRWAYDRAKLDNATVKYSWFVKIDEIKLAGIQTELWVLQSGARPGSDYLLLERRQEKNIIKSFGVLPLICPPEFERKADPIDVWATNYCAINSADDLRRLARRMAKRTPVGTLSFVDRAPDSADE